MNLIVENIENFGRGLGTTDLMIYAGIGLLIWLFLVKDNMGAIKSYVGGLLSRVQTPTKSIDATKAVELALLGKTVTYNEEVERDPFFELIVSWKKTRDLAAKCSCDKAVEVADEMFPFLSPSVCGKGSK